MSRPIAIDRTSLLVELDANTTLGVCENALAAEGLTLGLDRLDDHVPVGEWLADGADGARDPWTDPADHLVAGLEATLLDGRALVIRPAPRRAVGPDLVALVVGMKGRFARLDRVSLRIHVKAAPRPLTHPLLADRNPPLTPAEAQLLERIARELTPM